MIKLRLLRWRNYPGLSGWALNEITSVLFRRRQKDLKTEEEEGNVITAAGGEKVI